MENSQDRYTCEEAHVIKGKNPLNDLTYSFLVSEQQFQQVGTSDCVHGWNYDVRELGLWWNYKLLQALHPVYPTHLQKQFFT